MSRLSKLSFILLLSFVGFSIHALETFNTFQFELKQKPYILEIADTQARKMQGLMFRQKLSSDHGMLFVYDQSAAHYIWMKNTRIPLTVLWLDQEARIIDKQLLLPCKGYPCPSYGPRAPSQFIIELSDNQFNRFEVGDRLKSILKWYQQIYSGSS